MFIQDKISLVLLLNSILQWHLIKLLEKKNIWSSWFLQMLKMVIVHTLSLLSDWGLSVNTLSDLYTPFKNDMTVTQVSLFLFLIPS